MITLELAEEGLKMSGEPKTLGTAIYHIVKRRNEEQAKEKCLQNPN